MMILLWFYLRKKTVIELVFRGITRKLQIFIEILTVGISTFLRQMLLTISFAVLNQNSMIVGGPDLLAAIGIAIRVSVLGYNLIYGIGQGFQPVIGFNYGTKNQERALEALRYTLLITAGITTFVAAIFFLFPRFIFAIFQAEANVVAYGVTALGYFGLSMVLAGFTNTVTVFYQALGRPSELFILSTGRQGYLFIPCIIIMSRTFGSAGLMASQFVADLMAFMMALVMVRRFIGSGNLNELFSEAAL